VDANGRPETFPRIILGEDQELPTSDIVDRYTTLSATMHIWVRETGLMTTKIIARHMRRILAGQPPWTLNGYRCIDTRLQMVRYLRDPDGETSHGVITFQATIEEL
jgi:hypothetical protein